MRTSNALRHIEHIASLKLAPHIAIPEMLRTLREIVPGARTEFFWVGPQGEVLDAYAPASAVASGAWPAATQAHPAARDNAALLRFEADGGFHLTVHAQGQRRAILTMRRARPAPFTERERRMLVALAPCFGRAIESLPTTCREADDLADRIGVILATADGRLVSADAQARQLLIEMMDQPLTSAALSEIQEDILPRFLAEYLRAQGRGAAAPAVLQRSSRWGVYRARAFQQLGAGGDATRPPAAPTYAVMLSHHLPRTVRIMRALERFDLSPRERQAAFQLGIGADAATGAAALKVSVATWRSYVKRVYQRLDVNDRVGLVNRLHEAMSG